MRSARGHLCCNLGCDNPAVYGGLCPECQQGQEIHDRILDRGEWPESTMMLKYVNGEVKFERIQPQVEQIEWPDEIDPDRRMQC